MRRLLDRFSLVCIAVHYSCFLGDIQMPAGVPELEWVTALERICAECRHHT